MLQNMLTAAEQVAILYILGFIGFIADKTGVFKESTAKKCTDVLFYVVTPAKILESFFTLEYSDEHLKGLFIAIGCGLLMHTIAALGVLPLFNKTKSDSAVVYKFAAVYGNCGYMGLPLVEAVLGSEGVFYCSAVIISFQIFTFTHGVWAINQGKDSKEAKFDIKKIILNPGVLPVFVGLPVFLISKNHPDLVPNIIMQPVKYIGSMNSPLAMLIFGTYVANTSFKSIFKNWRIYIVGLYKLILLPLVVALGFRLAGLNGVLASTIIITAATPPANNTIMFCAKYDRDTGLASQIVSLLSIVSIITLPVMIALGDLIVQNI